MTGKEHPPKSSSVLSVPSLGVPRRNRVRITLERRHRGPRGRVRFSHGFGDDDKKIARRSDEDRDEEEEKMRLFEEKNKNKTIGEEFVLPAAAAKTTDDDDSDDDIEEEEENNTNNIVKPKVVAIVGASETLRTATIREYERLYPEVAAAPLGVTADVSMAVGRGITP